MTKTLLLGAAMAMSVAMLASGAQAHSRDRGCWLFDGHHRHATHVRGYRKHVHRTHHKAKVTKTKATAAKAENGKAKAVDTKGKGDAKK